ncbi:hypothetical protein ABT214_22720 [Micromonospora purpureochromogenes]|uniref:hypothetical protein n=1 Tax=Micromonospora purpureochromogenes TaxID=47872 RepID=UPI00332A2FAE
MGDWFETIADVEATAEEADRLGVEVLSWLVEQGIVMAEQTDCILGGTGYAPGPDYGIAVTQHYAHMHRQGVNGLNVVTGRAAFYSMGVDRIVCPHCQSAAVDQDDEEHWPSFSESIDSWYAGGSGVESCPHCGKSAGLNEWHWSPPWGFGYLGFEFWNWPPLDPGFITDVANLLGHRVVTPCGKI